MDINKAIKDLKAMPGFSDHVGMMLIHNGVVRGWSRKDRSPVGRIIVKPDREKMAAICREMEQRPGIFKILADVNEGELAPGDDVLFLVVAGDIREHVKSTFAELLDRVKSEAVVKQEYSA
ncbi:MAG: molybdenum cofactor biosynthesis protein MoaE [Desulfovibrio sp.]|nr:molybdenum cofactor biosynthesis protein MoaE [Desulfovibrio sp.]